MTASDQDNGGKVVYILGAGFSKPAGAPSQAGILEEILRLPDEGHRLAVAKDKLRRFLLDDLRIRPERIADVALEDIYTPIDRCIADGTSMKSQSASQLAEFREQLEYLISRAISTAIARYLAEHPGASGYVDDFAAHIVAKAARRAELAKNATSSAAAKAYDPLSIISLNWDILLDNAIHSALGNDSALRGDYDPFGVVDYCCYVSSLESGDPRIRSGLWSLGCKGYNVKLLKLHGSMNWLQCPNCQRLFVQFGSKQQILEHLGTTLCRHCERCGHENHLVGSLVMPTFLKDLSNFQIKLVWQNAGVELMEAKKLVFIGYSLPNADFEFRQLLSRMVHRDAAVEVILWEGTMPGDKERYRAEVERYTQFFGARDIRFHGDGVMGYVSALCASSVSA
jgi:NAD-dependent SIR2 family protein deacetylase